MPPRPPGAEKDWLRLPVVSLAAEYLVMGHLLRRNILTYKAPPGNEGYDLICIHHDPRHVPYGSQRPQIRVQVKSRYATDCDRGFPIKKRASTLSTSSSSPSSTSASSTGRTTELLARPSRSSTPCRATSFVSITTRHRPGRRSVFADSRRKSNPTATRRASSSSRRLWASLDPPRREAVDALSHRPRFTLPSHLPCG